MYNLNFDVKGKEVCIPIEHVLDLTVDKRFIYVQIFDNLDDTISDVGNLFITNTHTKKLEDTYLLIDSYNKNTAFVNTMMFLYITMIELIVVYKANIDINDYVAIITDVDIDDNDEEKSIKYVGLNYKVFELFEKILKNNKENKEEIDFVINLGKSFYNKAVESI